MLHPTTQCSKRSLFRDLPINNVREEVVGCRILTARCCGSRLGQRIKYANHIKYRFWYNSEFSSDHGQEEVQAARHCNCDCIMDMATETRPIRDLIHSASTAVTSFTRAASSDFLKGTALPSFHFSRSIPDSLKRSAWRRRACKNFSRKVGT